MPLDAGSDAGPTTTSLWHSTSGELPTQTCVPWTLVDTADPEDPVLASDILTLSTSEDAENIAYVRDGAIVTIRFTHGASGKITKVDFPCAAPPSELATCLRKVFLGREDLFDGKGQGETTIGPACP